MARWRWAITWDNAVPDRNSGPLRKALRGLGQVVFPETKTSALLAPKRGVRYKQFRKVVANHLHKRDGNVFYVNLITGQAFQRGTSTRHAWKSL